jgi:hypothetical protein
MIVIIGGGEGEELGQTRRPHGDLAMAGMIDSGTVPPNGSAMPRRLTVRSVPRSSKACCTFSLTLRDRP